MTGQTVMVLRHIYKVSPFNLGPRSDGIHQAHCAEPGKGQPDRGHRRAEALADIRNGICVGFWEQCIHQGFILDNQCDESMKKPLPSKVLRNGYGRN